LEGYQESIHLEPIPLVRTRDGFRYFLITFTIKDDRPGICTEIVDGIRRSSKGANLKWILGNVIGEGRAVIIMLFEVPESEREEFISALNRVRNEIREIEKVISEEGDPSLGIFAPRKTKIGYVMGESRTVIITTDFLDHLVGTMLRGGDPLIRSLIGTSLYRTAYYRGFSIAEDLKRYVPREGIGLLEAALLELKVLGYFTGFSVREEENIIELEISGLTLTPQLEMNVDNPLIIGNIAGILDSSFGMEYEVKITDVKKLNDGYYVRILCKPASPAFEAEEIRE
jgi:hypothetical protein